jgi:hypothetical protein
MLLHLISIVEQLHTACNFADLVILVLPGGEQSVTADGLVRAVKRLCWHGSNLTRGRPFVTILSLSLSLCAFLTITGTMVVEYVPTLCLTRMGPGAYNPSVRTEVSLPWLHLPCDFQGVTQVTQQHALRLWQRCHLVH